MGSKMALEATLREGKKKSVDLFQVRETYGIFCDMLWADPLLIGEMLRIGKQRATRAAKRKAKR